MHIMHEITKNNICEDVTYIRNRNIIIGYTKPNGEKVAGLADNNLRYYRTEFLPRERSVKNMRELVQGFHRASLHQERPLHGGAVWRSQNESEVCPLFRE